MGRLPPTWLGWRGRLSSKLPGQPRFFISVRCLGQGHLLAQEQAKGGVLGQGIGLKVKVKGQSGRLKVAR